MSNHKQLVHGNQGIVKKIKQLSLGLLRIGLSPTRIAGTISAGIVLGIFPIYGPISLVCLGLAWLGRLNVPILLASYYSMAWLKPLLILPFLRAGEIVFAAEPMPISLVELGRRFSTDALGTLGEFGWSFVHALTGWLVTAPVLLMLLYPLALLLATRWRTGCRMDVE